MKTLTSHILESFQEVNEDKKPFIKLDGDVVTYTSKNSKGKTLYYIATMHFTELGKLTDPSDLTIRKKGDDFIIGAGGVLLDTWKIEDFNTSKFN